MAREMTRVALIMASGLCLGFFGGCAVRSNVGTGSRTSPGTGSEIVALAEDLHVLQVGHGVWVHTSLKSLPNIGSYPANGLVVVGKTGAILVDTPWTNDQTRTLLRWVHAARESEVRDAIVTHSHDDRCGGVQALLEAGVTIHALPLTTELAGRDGRHFSAKQLDFDGLIELSGEPISVFFPGPGHAPDNLVVWLPSRDVLFGGCLVKSAEAGNLGNLADADVAGWKTAIQRVIDRYPDVGIVVPGHGRIGGSDLLFHTLDLTALGGK